MFKDSKAFSGFAVDDLDAAKTFYGETLGLDARTGEMGNVDLHLAGGLTVFIYPKPDHVPATYTILNFPVADIEAAVDQLTAAGVTMERLMTGVSVRRRRGVGTRPAVAFWGRTGSTSPLPPVCATSSRVFGPGDAWSALFRPSLLPDSRALGST